MTDIKQTANIGLNMKHYVQFTLHEEYPKVVVENLFEHVHQPKQMKKV